MERLLREGLPVSVLVKFRDNWGLTIMESASSISTPKSTLMRMLERRNRMASGDSDRVCRLASILALAEEYIGDRKKAQRWLRQPNQALGNQTPLRILDTEIGARRVERLLLSIRTLNPSPRPVPVHRLECQPMVARRTVHISRVAKQLGSFIVEQAAVRIALQQTPNRVQTLFVASQRKAPRSDLHTILGRSFVFLRYR